MKNQGSLYLKFISKDGAIPQNVTIVAYRVTEGPVPSILNFLFDKSKAFFPRIDILCKTKRFHVLLGTITQ